MDFISGLPKSPTNHDSMWVIVDRLTKTTHFIPILMTYSMDRLAELYVQHIVRLHGVQNRLYLIVILDLRRNFGKAFKMPWVPD